MEYTSLYRKFRPLTFDEILGQEHITKTLKNQIIADRVGHAYLFNGGRGTGKTSAAKILARAVNCLNPKNGEPCNECEMCKAALDGSLTDIVEMDAASNNGVDNIRQIREESNFLPTLAKYRVYIIDEVHMLSIGAFNALLKTLEEPPAHVKFILATTEPQKLPATILSRCQRFDFKKISKDNIEKELNIVCKKSKIKISPEAISTIAILAEGGMRDALSILERCSQEDTQITEELVKDLVGIPQTTTVNKLINNIVNKDVNSSLDTISDVLNNGKDIENFLWEIIKYIKDILLFKSTGNIDLYSQDEISKIKIISNKVSTQWLINTIYTLSDLSNRLKWSSQKNIIFQVEIIKLCSDNSSNLEIDNLAINKLQDEINDLKNKLNTINTLPKKEVEKQEEKKQKEKFVDTKSEMKKITKKDETKVIEPTGEYLTNWSDIINNIKQNGKILVYTNLINSKAMQINDMTVGITFPNGLTPFGKSLLEQIDNMNEIVKQVSIGCGKPMRVKLIENNSDTNNPVINNKIKTEDGIENKLDIPINIIND